MVGDEEWLYGAWEKKGPSNPDRSTRLIDIHSPHHESTSTVCLSRSPSNKYPQRLMLEPCTTPEPAMQITGVKAGVQLHCFNRSFGHIASLKDTDCDPWHWK